MVLWHDDTRQADRDQNGALLLPAAWNRTAPPHPHNPAPASEERPNAELTKLWREEKTDTPRTVKEKETPASGDITSTCAYAQCPAPHSNVHKDTPAASPSISDLWVPTTSKVGRITSSSSSPAAGGTPPQRGGGAQPPQHQPAPGCASARPPECPEASSSRSGETAQQTQASRQTGPASRAQPPPSQP